MVYTVAVVDSSEKVGLTTVESYDNPSSAGNRHSEICRSLFYCNLNMETDEGNAVTQRTTVYTGKDDLTLQPRKVTVYTRSGNLLPYNPSRKI